MGLENIGFNYIYQELRFKRNKLVIVWEGVYMVCIMGKSLENRGRLLVFGYEMW